MFMNITIRPTTLADGQAISELVKSSNTLDINSSYLYFLLADHFSQTCALAHDDNNCPLGFVTAYRLPKEPSTLFVWQIAVASEARGNGLAKKLLLHFASQPWFEEIDKVVCTISPYNTASNALFESYAAALGGKLSTHSFLTEEHLGADHDPEPYVVIDLTL
ncbi:diaminobutyrate acetyltransferase [Thiomicrospira sp. ALE5]|uniref:diaminobutyrate acetyltransferase n=1 Tax=Thiomicrospira sp. ALE5 TaxID=748650 RepID=UPI0008E10E17|nr:diaminobutyrate acetyltransferase [Thiomicrospira sp. ALE5]SFR48721.1 L-2,4-diaminobutyric acid acetyltransferase [Thiomicrospira sp. ALE5]